MAFLTHIKLRFCVFAVVIGMSGPSFAQEDHFSFQPSIDEQFKAESNPLLVSGDSKTLLGSVTTPQFKITDYNDTNKLSAQASASEGIYNLSNFDSTDAHGAVDYSTKLERWNFGLNANADYDTTLTSEISTLNTQGLGAIRHIGGSASPEVSYNLNNADRISLSGSYLTSHYDSNLYSDYHIELANPSYSYNFNPLNSLIFSAPVQRYQTDSNASVRIDSVTPTLGWNGNLTPTISAKASVGAQRYSADDNSLPDSSDAWHWEFVYSASLTFKAPRDDLALSASKDLQPYINGSESFLNTLAITDDHKFNELLSSNVGASYRFGAKSETTGNDIKSLVSTNIGLTYHTTDRLDIGTSYQFREQELYGVSGNQNDNLFLINLVYRPVLSFLDNSSQ